MRLLELSKKSERLLQRSSREILSLHLSPMDLESGATAVVAERGQEGIAKVREILGGEADAALGVLHNGGRLGFVGVPHYENRAIGSTFGQNTIICGVQLLLQHTISNSY